MSKKGKRATTYAEHARKRDRATERKALREKMREKQAPFLSKSKQSYLFDPKATKTPTTSPIITPKKRKPKPA